jgi:tetratricopeptide (TPR) repeat protein
MLQTSFLFCLVFISGEASWKQVPGAQAGEQEKALRVNAAKSLNAVGLSYYEREQYERAVLAFQDALKYDPSNEAIRTNLAISYLQQGKFSRVIEILGASGNAPADQRSITALAVSCFALGKYDQAARYYEKLAQMLPDDAVLRLTWAVACEFSGQSQQAQSILAGLPKEKNTQAQYRVVRGDAYRSQLKVKQAIAEYESALALSGDLPDVNYRLGVLYSDLNDYDKAIDAFRRELTINPRNSDANYSLGAYYLTTTDLEQSRRYFEKTIELNPNHLGAYLGLMKIELSQKQPAAAIEWAKKAEAGGRDIEELHYLKSRAFNLLGQSEQADKEMRIFEEMTSGKKAPRQEDPKKP